MELLKDYDYVIDYDLSKANVIVDAFSRKATASFAYIQSILLSLVIELKDMGMVMHMHPS